MITTGFAWLIFLGASLVAVFSAIMMVTRRSPIHSALWLVVTFFSIAIIYLQLHAQFIAVAQVIVYAGAIMMLIVFVIMLLDLQEEARAKLKLVYSKVFGSLLAVLFLFGILYAVAAGSLAGKTGAYPPEKMTANVKTVGEVLFTQYFFPFEIASILLVAAIVGAVVLSKKKKT